MVTANGDATVTSRQSNADLKAWVQKYGSTRLSNDEFRLRDCW